MAWKEIFPATVVLQEAKHLWAMRVASKYKIAEQSKVIDSIVNVSMGETHIALACELIGGNVTIRLKDTLDAIKGERRFHGEAGNEYVVTLPVPPTFTTGTKYIIELWGTPDRAQELNLWNAVVLGVTLGGRIWKEVEVTGAEVGGEEGGLQ